MDSYNKSTLVCIHVLPLEIEMFERWINMYEKSLIYLDKKDNVTLNAVLNLNPYLTDWENSSVSKEYFATKFLNLIDSIPNICSINYGSELMGTTQHKRESIKLNYDQFIFCDADIIFPEQLLKYQLEASYMLKDNYILIPNIIRLWDETWDPLVHKDFLSKDFNYYKTHDPNITLNQSVENISLKLLLGPLKFGCGMHTLYSKSFWDLIGIPESFGGYGPEDTFAMFAGNIYNNSIPETPILEYVLEGIYITEDYLNRIPSFNNDIITISLKQEQRKQAELNFNKELEKFIKDARTIL